MDPMLHEWLNLLVRWFHVVAGIMWIGTSIYFNWLENSLIPPKNPRPGDEGEAFMVHGGGYYHVIKRQIESGKLPEPLHWFKWEAYATWLTGITLLVVVYYLGGKAFLVDPAVADIGMGTAVAIGVGTLLASWLFYDRLWESSLAGNNVPVASALTAAWILGAVYGLTHVFNGRAAYIHVGALLGTLMVGNVWRRIIPAQQAMVAAALAGLPVDHSLAKKGKWRSRHNNYFTYPVIFIMISNHFPSTFGSQWNWIVLAVLMVAGATVKHFLNVSETFKAWLPASLGIGVAALAVLYVLTAPSPSEVNAVAANAEKVTFAQVQAVVRDRCLACHSAHPTDDTFTQPPGGVMFDTAAQIQSLAPRIQSRAVDTKTMPFGNKTGITEAERALLGRWISQGASLD